MRVSWNKRFLAVQGDVLRYFRSVEDVLLDRPLGTVHLRRPQGGVFVCPAARHGRPPPDQGHQNASLRFASRRRPDQTDLESS